MLRTGARQLPLNVGHGGIEGGAACAVKAVLGCTYTQHVLVSCAVCNQPHMCPRPAGLKTRHEAKCGILTHMAFSFAGVS